MGENTEKTHQPLNYKTSTDWEKGKSGIKAVVVTDEAQLIEAGVEAETAKILMKNLNPENNEITRIVVIKDENNKPVRVFSGNFYPCGSFEEKDKDGQPVTTKDGKVVKVHYNADLTLTKTIDLSEPNELVRMDKGIQLDLGIINDGRDFNQKHVDKIQKAIIDRQISHVQGIDAGIKLAEYSPSFDSWEVPNIPNLRGGVKQV